MLIWSAGSVWTRCRGTKPGRRPVNSSRNTSVGSRNRGASGFRCTVPARASSLAGAIPALGLEGCPVQLELRRYHPACRATFEARVGYRQLAVKAYAEDPADEVRLYQALAAAGLAGDSGVRAPSLLAWDR